MWWCELVKCERERGCRDRRCSQYCLEGSSTVMLAGMWFVKGYAWRSALKSFERRIGKGCGRVICDEYRGMYLVPRIELWIAPLVLIGYWCAPCNSAFVLEPFSLIQSARTWPISPLFRSHTRETLQHWSWLWSKHVWSKQNEWKSARPSYMSKNSTSELLEPGMRPCQSGQP